MIGYKAVLRCNLLFGKLRYMNMSYISYIPVSNIFTIIGLIEDSILKHLNDTRRKIFEIPIFEMKVVALCDFTFKYYLQFPTNKYDFLITCSTYS